LFYATSAWKSAWESDYGVLEKQTRGTSQDSRDEQEYYNYLLTKG